MELLKEIEQHLQEQSKKLGFKVIHTPEVLNIINKWRVKNNIIV